ncbi:MAG: excinuclease ABC subunit UvrA [Nitrospiraceae bacterium]|nr:excinuclease ABC subunit UvrA [Nitrospiraceae bacterium]
MSDELVVKGAREHNLKDVSLAIPRNRLVVFTGLSGSGKSSLAFDTIFAEGQRRYLESLSSYARQFLGQLDKPDVDQIDGLSPAISIDQKSAPRNPRSTVGTVTEVHDYLRLLFARVGVQHCHNCGAVVERQTPQQIVDRLMDLPEGTRYYLMAPVVEGRKGEYSGLLRDLARKGFARARVDGEMIELEQGGTDLARYEMHHIEVVVDRLVRRDGMAKRLTDSVETALELGGRRLKVLILATDAEPERETVFSELLACNNCGISFDELAPRNFSFNSPYGACSACTGLGTSLEVDEALVVPDHTLSLYQGAIAPWAQMRSDFYLSALEGLAQKLGFDMKTPWSQLPEKVQGEILRGGGGHRLPVRMGARFRRDNVNIKWEGVIPWLRRRYDSSSSEGQREMIRAFMTDVPCESCKGRRLRPESLAVLVEGLSIADLSAMSINRCASTVAGFSFGRRSSIITGPILREVSARLRFLLDVGLEYLTLDRAANTLSGGEAQRIRLASQIGSGLTGVLYVLDEPSIGLHQRDNHRLIETLMRLRDLDNSVIVVEHDEDTIRAADYIVDIGPGAGERGGRVVAAGSVEDIMAEPESITGDYLARRRRVDTPKRRREPNGHWVSVKGALANNLKGIDVDIPLGCFVAVTGVSGSGKSSLVNDILRNALMLKIYRSKVVPGRHREILGIENLDKVVDIDQSPIGRTPRSNPATYTGVFDKIRALFAATPEARVRGYEQGRFSFNLRGGRCEACAGDGTIRIEMNFLPDVYVPCEQCKGTRYNRDTLEILYRGKSIADVLDMPVDEALEFFARLPSVERHLRTLSEVGLGYVRLGQPATTLSGGEAQRVKLASELAKRPTGHTFYILDEPTTGLHFEDVRKLLVVLERLVENGNTVLVIEHNLDVIRTADWLIDLGPEGGDRGGEVVATGTPEQVALVEASHTGKFLR